MLPVRWQFTSASWQPTITATLQLSTWSFWFDLTYLLAVNGTLSWQLPGIMRPQGQTEKKQKSKSPLKSWGPATGLFLMEMDECNLATTVKVCTGHTGGVFLLQQEGIFRDLGSLKAQGLGSHLKQQRSLNMALLTTQGCRFPALPWATLEGLYASMSHTGSLMVYRLLQWGGGGC